jgi:hypothetical protein
MAPGAGDRWLLVWLFTPGPKADWRSASSTVIRGCTLLLQICADHSRDPVPLPHRALVTALDAIGSSAKPAVLTGMPTAHSEIPQQIGHAE